MIFLGSWHKFTAIAQFWRGSPAFCKSLVLFEKEDGSLNSVQDYDVCELKQKCLDEAAKRGYVPFTLAPYLLFTSLTKEAAVPNREPKFYRSLSTMKASTLEKELNEAAQQGFHFFINSNLSEVLMVKEGSAPISSKYEYILKAANKEKDVAQLNELSKQGYRPVGNQIVSGYLIFERSAQSASQDSYTEFKILDKRDKKKLETDLQEAASQNWNTVFIGGTSAVYRVILTRTVSTKSK